MSAEPGDGLLEPGRRRSLPPAPPPAPDAAIGGPAAAASQSPRPRAAARSPSRRLPGPVPPGRAQTMPGSRRRGPTASAETYLSHGFFTGSRTADRAPKALWESRLREARDLKLNLSAPGHGSIASATTHSAAVERLLHVAGQPLIAALGFPPLLPLRGPSPPAQPHQEARGGRAGPGRTRRAKARRDFPPPGARAGGARGGCRSRVGADGGRKPEPALRGASPQPPGGISHRPRPPPGLPARAGGTRSHGSRLPPTRWAREWARAPRRPVAAAWPGSPQG